MDILDKSELFGRLRWLTDMNDLIAQQVDDQVFPTLTFAWFARLPCRLLRRMNWWVAHQSRWVFVQEMIDQIPQSVSWSWVGYPHQHHHHHHILYIYMYIIHVSCVHFPESPLRSKPLHVEAGRPHFWPFLPAERQGLNGSTAGGSGFTTSHYGNPKKKTEREREGIHPTLVTIVGMAWFGC